MCKLSKIPHPMELYNHDEVVKTLETIVERLKAINTEQGTGKLLSEIDAVANDFFNGHCCHVTFGKGEGTASLIRYHEDEE